MQPASSLEPASDDNVSQPLVRDGALAPVGHSLESERFVEQHGGVS
jgi:hypothetical protein